MKNESGYPILFGRGGALTTFWFLSLVILCGCGSNQEYPKLVVSDSHFDLGHGCPGEELSGRIFLKNEGSQLLEIEGIEKGCACSSVQVESTTIPPGGQVAMTVVARIKSEGQHLRFPIRILSNDPGSPEVVITVRADSGPPFLRTEPEQLDFGEIPLASRPCKSLRILMPDGQPWPVSQPLSVESETGRVRAELLPIGTDKASEDATLMVELRTDLPRGPFQDTLTVRSGDGARSIHVPVRGKVIPLLVIAPNVLLFSDVDPGSGPVERFLVFRRTDGKQLPRIVKTSAPAGITVAPDSGPADSTDVTSVRRLRVTLSPAEAKENVKEGNLQLWLEKESEPMTVRVLISFKG